MGLLIGTGILIAIIVLSVVIGVSPVYALFAGTIIYSYLAYRMEYSLKDIRDMCWKGILNSKVVLIMMLIIGLLTASWRLSGTICYFVYYGVKSISPSSFLIVGFLLACLVSYAVGSSFATTAAVGVIFMALARAGGVNELLVGGMIISGIYFGDRGSPASSASLLVASVTRTNHMDNVKRMAKFCILPFALCIIIYSILSVKNPIHVVDDSFLTSLAAEFTISHLAVIPALIMLILPFVGLDIIKCMGLSIATSVIVALTIQGADITTLIKTLIFGYSSNSELGTIFNGGGVLSMIDVVLVVALSGTYSGIFEVTGMLETVQDKIGLLIRRTGRFFTTLVIGSIVAAIACNQSFPTVVAGTLFDDVYIKNGGTREELASDIQNSFLVTVGLIPWAIANSVPRSFMNVPAASTKYAFYLMLVPLCYAIQKPLVYRWARKHGKNFMGEPIKDYT